MKVQLLTFRANALSRSALVRQSSIIDLAVADFPGVVASHCISNFERGLLGGVIVWDDEAFARALPALRAVRPPHARPPLRRPLRPGARTPRKPRSRRARTRRLSPAHPVLAPPRARAPGTISDHPCPPPRTIPLSGTRVPQPAPNGVRGRSVSDGAPPRRASSPRSPHHPRRNSLLPARREKGRG